MSLTIRILQHEAVSQPFVDHHSLEVPPAGAELTLGPELKAGGFGALHEVKSIGGRPAFKATLAKVFKPDALARTGGADSVVDSMRDLQEALASSNVTDWPDCVLALTYVVASAEVRGEQGLVALMLDLRALGYSDAPFAQQAELIAYKKRPYQERVDIAVKLSQRAELLESIRFIHGDMNPENLMLNLSTFDVQIIDFDAGAVVKSGHERPRTPGKPGMCMPPEVKATGPTGKQADTDKFDLAAERWSLGSLIGYCLLGYHPGFFLRAISQPVVADYARQPQAWPLIDTAGPLFTDSPANRKLYPRLVAKELKVLSPRVRERFEEFFRAGLQGEKRPSAAEWQVALRSLTEPPKIERFELDEQIVFQGMIVTLSWSAPTARSVEIDGHGEHPPVGDLQIVAEKSTVFRVRAVNPYGQAIDRAALRVLPVPRLGFVPVPEGPEITFTTVIPVVALGPTRSSPDWVPDFADVFAGGSRAAAPLVPLAPQAESLLRFVPNRTFNTFFPSAPDATDLLAVAVTAIDALDIEAATTKAGEGK